jgi:hypothetical protein
MRARGAWEKAAMVMLVDMSAYGHEDKVSMNFEQTMSVLLRLSLSSVPLSNAHTVTNLSDNVCSKLIESITNGQYWQCSEHVDLL